MGLDLSSCAPKLGMLGCSAVLAFGFVELFLGPTSGFGEALWTIITACIMAPIEIPSLFTCTDSCSLFKRFILGTLRMNNWYLRGALYIALSILMYFGGHVWAILAAIVTDVMGVSYLAAEWQGLRETEERTQFGYVPSV